MLFKNIDTQEIIDIDWDELIKHAIKNRDNSLYPRHKYPKPLPKDVMKYAKQAVKNMPKSRM